MEILSIDPSLNHLGWARMKTGFDMGGGPNTLVAWGTIKMPTESKNWELVKRIASIVAKLDAIVKDYSVDKVIIEQPESWGAYKSMASAHSGSLLSLHILTGAILMWGLIVAEASRIFAPGAELIKVSKWKGQLPKAVTKKRMEQKYGVEFATSDEADAVGLGDYYLGQLAKEKADGSTT